MLFKDNCTNEMAMNPPAKFAGPAAEVAPQQPQAAYVPAVSAAAEYGDPVSVASVA